MAERVCPVWLGYLLASPIRRWMQNPEELLAPYVRTGMTVLEPGPGMGFFTLPLARMTGPKGRVIAVDTQAKMLQELRRRAEKDRLMARIQTRLAQPDQMGLDDLKGKVDFSLAYAMVHETPSAEGFFKEVSSTLRPGGMVLLVEPAGHVKPEKFQTELEAAQGAGLEPIKRPAMRRCHAAVLCKA